MGRPPKDGSKPVQRKALAAETPDPLRRVPPPKSDLAKCVRDLAEDGLMAEDIAALTGCDVEDLEKDGAYHRDVQIGRALGSHKLCRELKTRALKGHPILTIYATKAIAGLSETGRKAPAKSENGEISEITVKFVDDDSKRARGEGAARTRVDASSEKAEEAGSGAPASAPEKAAAPARKAPEKGPRAGVSAVGKTAPREGPV